MHTKIQDIELSTCLMLTFGFELNEHHTTSHYQLPKSRQSSRPNSIYTHKSTLPSRIRVSCTRLPASHMPRSKYYKITNKQIKFVGMYVPVPVNRYSSPHPTTYNIFRSTFFLHTYTHASACHVIHERK